MKLAQKILNFKNNENKEDVNESAISDSWETKERVFGDDFYIGKGELEKELSKSPAAHKQLVKGLLIQTLSANEDKIAKAMAKGKDVSVKHKTKVDIVVEIDPDYGDGNFLYKIIY